jgi:hypothetical protein
MEKDFINPSITCRNLTGRILVYLHKRLKSWSCAILSPCSKSFLLLLMCMPGCTDCQNSHYEVIHICLCISQYYCLAFDSTLFFISCSTSNFTSLSFSNIQDHGHMWFHSIPQGLDHWKEYLQIPARVDIPDFKTGFILAKKENPITAAV